MEAQLRGWRHSPGEGMKEWRRVRQEPWGNWGRGKGRGKQVEKVEPEGMTMSSGDSKLQALGVVGSSKGGGE